MIGTRFTSLLSVFATLIVGATAAVAATNAPHDLPTGFTVSSNFREDVRRRVYWDFDTVQYEYVPANSKNTTREKVEGHLWRTAVAAVQPTNNSDAVVALMAADFEKDGWTILRRQGVFVAHKTGGGHELWVNGAGNSGDFRLALVEVAPPGRGLTLKVPQAQVETVSDNQDLPYVLSFPGSKMQKTVYDHRSFEILLPNSKQASIAIPAMTRWYDEPPGVSSYEFAAVYRKALEAAGWDITRAQVGGDVAMTAHYAKNGRDIWLHTGGNGVIQSINIVDYGAESQESTLKQQLAKDGHVALYGIYFDTDSSVPRPESEATLQNVLQMLKADTSLKLEVQGHTDNTGAPDHNATLSDARAASVKQWLTTRGIGPDLLSSKGYGATKPVADNNSQEGKAKNRRVELVKTAP